MQSPNLTKNLDEMNAAATELTRAEPSNAVPASPPPPPQEEQQAENPSAKTLAWLYFLTVFPFFGGVLVAVECRVVFGMYQLLALAGGVVFGRWVFDRRPSVEGVTTLQQAWNLVSQKTALFGAAPAAAGVAFLFVDYAFGVVWAYAVAGVVALLSAGAVEGKLVDPVSDEETERGRKQGGIDDKLRDEYEKALREHKGQQ